MTTSAIFNLVPLFVLDDLHDARNNLTELTRRLHELEIELRRLENEREELTAAYKEAEAVSLLSCFVCTIVYAFYMNGSSIMLARVYF